MMDAIVPLVSLIALEVILGIDNIIFISILSDKLPDNQRNRLRFWGIGLAMVMRLLLLAFISWILKLDKTIFNLVQGIIQNKLKSTMEDFFNATIQDYVKSATKLLEGKEIMQTYTISGKLLDYNISNFAISDSRMYFNLVSKFSGQLRVKEF